LKCNLLLIYNAEFSASLLQSSVSHDPSEIILICRFAGQETFHLIISFKQLCYFIFFVETVMHFDHDYLIETSK